MGLMLSLSKHEAPSVVQSCEAHGARQDAPGPYHSHFLAKAWPEPDLR
jgi:hypothetical protein